MKRLLLLNPQSQNGRAEVEFETSLPKWRSLLGEFEWYRTTGPGDATRRVRECLATGGAEQIIVAGGDGSIHEAAEGYWDETGEPMANPVPMGIINLGTGGDFYRSVCGACSGKDYESALVENRSTRIDVGVVRAGNLSEKRFLNISSAGLAGEMNQRMKASRFQSGAAAYFFHSVATLAAYEPKPVVIEWIDETGTSHTVRESLINGFVCNGRFSGGGMEWAPGAQLDDGLLRVTAILGRSKWPLVIHSRKVYAGEIERFPSARTFVAKSLVIKAEEPVSVEADGELLSEGEREIGFGVEPAAFPLVG